MSVCAQMHGQAVDFRLPHDWGEAGAWGGPAELPVPLGLAPSVATGLPPKKPKAGAPRSCSIAHLQYRSVH